MKKLVLISLILLLIMLPVFAEENVPYFTEEDLQDYQYSPYEEPSMEDESFFDEDDEEKLKRYEIPYIAFEGTARRIIIPVTINGHITANMALDTGAPGMQISFKLARKLGVLDEDESSLWIVAGGIGGIVPAVFTVIDTVQIGEAEDSFIPTIVSSLPSSEFEGLIGMDFLSKYSVLIDTVRNVLVLEELPKTSEMPGGHDENWWKLTFHRFEMWVSAWEEYRDYLNKLDDDSTEMEELRGFADRQYQAAQELSDRLWVYASDNAVPREWR